MVPKLFEIFSDFAVEITLYISYFIYLSKLLYISSRYSRLLAIINHCHHFHSLMNNLLRMFLQLNVLFVFSYNLYNSTQQQHKFLGRPHVTVVPQGSHAQSCPVTMFSHYSNATTLAGYKFLTFTDYYTKFADFCPLREKSAQSKKRLENITPNL